MAKAMYAGVNTEFPIYEENVETVVITADNIYSYFAVQNDTYYFAGSGNTFTANNLGKNSTTAKTTLIALQDISNITFDYSYLTEPSYDKFTLVVAGTTVENGVSGYANAAAITKSYTGSLSKDASIVFTYAKDSSTSMNNECCTFLNMNITAIVKVQVGTENKGIAQNALKGYIGINNIARKIKRGYIGDKNNIARLFLAEGRFVAVDYDNGRPYYSDDGKTWLAGNTITYKKLMDVTYGNGRFVTVGYGGSSYYSLDGITWTKMTGLDTSYYYSGVAYSNGRFVCVGGKGRSYYSLDGETWTAMTGLYSSYYYNCITYGNGMFVCGGSTGDLRYSTDGETWTLGNTGMIQQSAVNVTAITYGNGKFVCGLGGYTYYSLDGKTWYEMSPNLNSVQGLAFGRGKFVAVCSNNLVAYSTDGLSWTSSSLSGQFRAVTYANARFVAVCEDGKSYYSLDGKTWTAMTGLYSSYDYYGVCYGEI